jgi:hypothetical protein
LGNCLAAVSFTVQMLQSPLLNTDWRYLCCMLCVHAVSDALTSFLPPTQHSGSNTTYHRDTISSRKTKNAPRLYNVCVDAVAQLSEVQLEPCCCCCCRCLGPS